MQSTEGDRSQIREIDHPSPVYAVAFTEDGKQVLSGGVEGVLKWWRIDDGREVGEAIQTSPGSEIFSVALSPDYRRLVCGLRFPSDTGLARVGVWDLQSREKVLDVHTHTNTVYSVDISPDSSKFATGGYDKVAFICSIETGEQLVGPLSHEGSVVTIRFSPNGDRVATVTSENPDAKSIRIFSSEDGHQLLTIPFRAAKCSAPLLTWLIDGHRLCAVSFTEAKCFDPTSGAVLGEWTFPGPGYPATIALAHNQKFFVVSGYDSLSFWDASTYKQVGTVIKHATHIWQIALSPTDDYLATCEKNGKVTIRGLRNILPKLYFTVNVGGCNSQLPLLYISDVALKSWTAGDLTRAEALLTDEIIRPVNPFYHARALANRALVRMRSKERDIAILDAEKSLKIQPSVIGHVANAVCRIGSGEYSLVMWLFDLAFSDGVPAAESKFLLLIKAIVMFECGHQANALSRVDSLINVPGDSSLYLTIRAHMLLHTGSRLLKEGENERAIELFTRAQEAIPFQQVPHLVVLSMIFGWDFDRLPVSIQLQLVKAMHAAGHTEVAGSLSVMAETFGEDALSSQEAIDWNPDLVQRCLSIFEGAGDAAVQSGKPKEAIMQYTAALSLNPSNAARLFVKRSKTQGTLGLWEEALKDANEAIKLDPPSPWGYERKHAALHGVKRYDEAIKTFTRMLSLIEESLDQDIRQLAEKYISPARSGAAIESAVHEILRVCPIVLIDVESGCLCDASERMQIFKSDLQFKELVSSMTEKLDEECIMRETAKFFQYVMLSHVWEGKEPSFQDVQAANSVWNLKLGASPLNMKLQKFCKIVRADGFRWAWSDTCCIDKTVSSVLNQSLTMMYKWYEASAATLVLLASVASPSVLGNLTDNIWMTRAWTVQELLVPKVIRFYDCEWKPYLGDTRSNHKESSEIMQELANAMGVSRGTITSFHPDDLSIREKLRLSSTRNATIEEDVAYSLIGIFKSDIRPHYGEGDAALGHLLEEIMARSNDLTVLAWAGKSSSYHSCLPATLAVYKHSPYIPPVVEDAEMDTRVAELKSSLSQEEALLIFQKINHLPPVGFANRRLHLPCIIFVVKRLGVQDFGSGRENRYRARVSGIGYVEFQTSDRLPLTEPRKLILVRPLLRDLCGPVGGFTWGTESDDEDSDSDPGRSPTSPMDAIPVGTVDDYTRALQLVVRLRRPFSALLLQQQSNGEFKRVAAEHEITAPGLERQISSAKDVHADVVEIL